MSELSRAITELRTHLENENIQGLPKSWFEEAQGSAPSDSFLSKVGEGVYSNSHAKDVKVAFVHVGDFNVYGESLSDILTDSGALLEGAITKGMKLSVENVCFLAADDDGEKEFEVVSSYLKKLGPKVVIAMGHHASLFLTKVDKPITKVRGSWFDIDFGEVVATFHPEYVIKSPSHKRDFWNDLQEVMKKL